MHVSISFAVVQLFQVYVNTVLIGAATKVTCEVNVEPTAAVPLGAFCASTTGVKDFKNICLGGLSIRTPVEG